ncbi:MAG: hypothetical protein OXI38_05555 [Bacteroidota bacterium]|nr:hypothetical protein [Bacteroidota bacterium]
MKRTSTRITAWPAIADLMTIIVVLGATVGLVAFGGGGGVLEKELRQCRDSTKQLLVTLEHLRDSTKQLHEILATKESTIDSLEVLVSGPGPPRCWHDEDGQVQRLFRIEIYRQHFRIKIIARRRQLAEDKEIQELVSEVQPERDYSQNELVGILRRVYDIGVSRTEGNQSGCRFWGRLVLKEEISASQLIKLTNLVNRFILTNTAEPMY